VNAVGDTISFLAAAVVAGTLASTAAAAERPPNFERADYRAVAGKAEIPATVLDLFDSLCGGCALADIGEPYNATDHIRPGLPMRRLVVAGVKDGNWFLEYEHGGRGHHSHFTLFALDEGAARCIWANGSPAKGCRPRAAVDSEIGSTCEW
jgi:hypothetical protein